MSSLMFVCSPERSDGSLTPLKGRGIYVTAFLVAIWTPKPHTLHGCPVKARRFSELAKKHD